MKKKRIPLPGQPKGFLGRIVPSLVSALIPGLTRLVGATWRTRFINREPLDEVIKNKTGGILVAWHGNLWHSLYVYRDMGAVGMVSPVWVGELIARTMLGLGFEVFRASSGFTPAAGLRQSLRVLKEGKLLAQVPDGPEGPPRVVKPGVIYLASMTGKPIFPSYAAVSPKVQAKSWDRHEIGMLFARLEVRVGEPMYVPKKVSKTDVEMYCRELEDRMRELECDAVLTLWRLKYEPMPCREREALREHADMSEDIVVEAPVREEETTLQA